VSASLEPWVRGPTLVGKRVTLEPLRVEHAAERAGVLADPDLHRYIGGAPATDQELARTYARLAAGSGDPTELWLNWVVRRKTDGQAIGTTQATVRASPRGLLAEAAWVIGTPYQGLGHATEAAVTMVTWLRSQAPVAVVAHVHPEHAASSAVARSIGLMPSTTLVDGEVEWVDT
jgi:RimJ/RimL family protein N-acetyltransferase